MRAISYAVKSRMPYPDDAERLAGTMLYLEDGRIAGQGPAAAFFGPDGPPAFQRYIGTIPGG